jgi:hypothetical protein
MMDPKKSAFTVVVVVLAVYLLIALAGAGYCGVAAWYEKDIELCSKNRLGEFLTSILAVALALYAGKK